MIIVFDYKYIHPMIMIHLLKTKFLLANVQPLRYVRREILFYFSKLHMITIKNKKEVI